MLFLGGNLFVQGSVALAIILGIPQLLIGLTVVSLGTSAPEFFVSASSVLRGADTLAVSNAIGSNIFNILVVLGLSSIIIPLKVESRLIRRDVPLLLAISCAFWGMSSPGKLTWQAGFALLIGLVINTIWEIKTARDIPTSIKDGEPEIDIENNNTGLKSSTLKILIGITILNIGSNILIKGSITVATLLGISESIIGLTIVSAGTSLPELITSVIAALKGKTDLAIGNVVGSNILNQLLVIGSAALIAGNSGLIVENILIERDIPFMVATTLALHPIFWSNGEINRQEGLILVNLYIFYILDKVIPIIAPDYAYTYKILLIGIVIPISILLIALQSIKYYLRVK